MKFKPSSGTELCQFTTKFCDRCERDREYRESENNQGGCEIFARGYFQEKEDDSFPSEWIYQDDRPVCTAFLLEGTLDKAKAEAAGQMTLEAK